MLKAIAPGFDDNDRDTNRELTARRHPESQSQILDTQTEMLWAEMILAVLASFAVTRLVTRSHILSGFRSCFRRLVFDAPRFISDHFVMVAVAPYGRVLIEPDGDEPADSVIVGYDFISCPMCVGFWVACTSTVLYGLPISCWIPCYGAAYLLDNLSDR
jgi:hypothetical protein